jgi:hypothetical protein
MTRLIDQPDGENPFESFTNADRSLDQRATETFLQLLARAVRQFHTYPPNSPFCLDAVVACRKALEAVHRRELLVFRVSPRELIVEGRAVGANAVIQELAQRLHRAGVALLSIDPEASEADLEQLCQCLMQCHESAAVALTDLLAERGVDKVEARVAEKVQILDLGTPRAPLCELASSERRRRDALFAAGAPVHHLYPPDKGWVRLDPTTTFSSVSLAELAVLIENPSELAAMLLRLTDEAGEAPDPSDASLERKFGDVSKLFASLEPMLARRMFAKLAQAVLDLEPDRRTQLLQHTVLPGLLDGRADGMVLHDFPDLDLADALCLLLDLETAAPDVLTVAFGRLDLPADRRRTVAPILQARVQAREAGKHSGDTYSPPKGLDRYAERLIHIDDGCNKSFAEFAAFDLSIDEAVAEVLAGFGVTIDATDDRPERLRCIYNLVSIETRTARLETLLGVAVSLLGDLERDSRWSELVCWLEKFRQLSTSIQQRRPQVAVAVSAALQRSCTRETAVRLLELLERDAEKRALVDGLIEAAGPAIAPALAALVEDPRAHAQLRSLTQLMCGHARVLALPLVERLGQSSGPAACAFVRVLGFAGAGYETVVGRQLAQSDGSIVREAARALARIGTPHAAAVVAKHIREANPAGRSAAEEALWHFPAPLIRTQLRELLGGDDFVAQHPDIVLRLLQRVARTGKDGLEPELVKLTQLRRRFWNPSLVRVASAARDLLAP